MPEAVRIRVLVSMRASPDGMTTPMYEAGQVYGPDLRSAIPVPPDRDCSRRKDRVAHTFREPGDLPKLRPDGQLG